MISFKLSLMIDTTKLYISTSVLMTDLHSRSQGYEKARICSVILLRSGMKKLIHPQWWNI